MKVEDKVRAIFTASNDRGVTAIADMLEDLLVEQPEWVGNIMKFINQSGDQLTAFAKKESHVEVSTSMTMLASFAKVGFEQAMIQVTNRVSEKDDAEGEAG